ncbi:Glutaredoxin-like protein, YruB-family [Candidatus Kryptobacter tengchongensis]|uniref:Glutaredoxin-like protein, YruB-family n=1 Tax=Kryptobacter tengchongensis TaxID=1643429 RepID=A0A656DG39_KRYT1|nr:Uxx-star family glutaredoxin-like (seleno)protein [Candidatus Kryptobacter tengchongensis]CUS76616.1 Glutaredoxin-like protein, YruB-family [Candidatus Kryptobacter tengchongensis]CUT05293.1 Glutaredoxin-like protein, YruB-family [Candidatus Kryptobacter tengchongensis]CUU07558.1 Glutaredoxin-like protein, YruB-family [Candidatus Kryptobacter tengchongensis]CUU09900.1 Glutaredoxin-like protein, YruB-family [Candidatus Kryptobacter tengchongensis]
MEQKQPKVIIFTTPTCPWCRAAKQYFMQKKIKFTEVDVTRDPRAAKDLIRLTGQTGVPVILINNRPVVGFDRAKIDHLLGLK